MGDTLDLFDGVTFTSSTQGDITSTVEIINDSELFQLGVYIISYQTHYENNELFSADRRIVVLYPPLSDNENNDNLLTNGDFSDNMNHWGTCRTHPYEGDVDFIIDPDRLRMQIIMTEASTMLSSPNLLQQNLIIESSHTYEIKLLVSGTNNTFFTIDMVELDVVNQVTATLLENQTIPVLLQVGEMQVIQFTFTPLASSTNATLRLMFGQDNGVSPTGEIYIDNVMLTIIE